MILFGVMDLKAEVVRFHNVQPTEGQAVRGFTILANDEQTEIGKFPEDFELLKLATIEESGRVVPESIPVRMGLASSYKK